MDNIRVDRTTLVLINSACEGGLLLLATLWCFNSGVNLSDALRPSLTAVLAGIAAGAVTALSGFVSLFLTGKAAEKSVFQQLRSLVYTQIAPLFKQLTLADIFLIAASTGFCEEIFFRGILQSEMGLLSASLLFGMIHCASVSMLPYAAWTCVAGIFLGYLYIWTGSLWAPILAHAVNNFIVIAYFKFRKS
ncbi:MAG TPA: CPBP family intramembrane glutamic endopeptidase [Drouetiella sp.]|jgi:membrane protease YdiL (CAAX protease family)